MSVFGLASAVNADEPDVPVNSTTTTVLVLGLDAAGLVPSRVVGQVRYRALSGEDFDENVLKTNEAMVQLLERADTVLVNRDLTESLENADAEAGDAASGKRGKLIASTLGALVHWVPTEIVALYGGVLAATAVAATATDTSAPESVAQQTPWTWLASGDGQTFLLWLVAVTATPFIVWLTAWINKKDRRKLSRAKRIKLRWTMFFSAIAFVFWSASIPGSAWSLIPWFKEESGLFLLVLLIAATLFSQVATKVTGAPSKPA